VRSARSYCSDLLKSARDFSRTSALTAATLITLEKITPIAIVAITSFRFIEMPFRRRDD
jgi:hypothetical protein